MTLIAGILSRNNRPLSESACASLRQSVSRNPDDEVSAFRDRLSYFAKLDIGAFGEPGFFKDSSGAMSFVAGEPLITNHDAKSHSNRLRDLTAIHEQCLENGSDILRAADGTFCVVHYHPQSHKLLLIADKVGVRPLYYWIGDDVIIFASALRILEGLPLVPKQFDLRAVTEIVGLGLPLGDRTPYEGILSLRPAEILEITNARVSKRRYWRWDELETSDDSEPELLKTVFRSFQAGVKRRSRNDRTTAAYLSGGLDSRCVVASLRQRDVNVHSFNFARSGTQDYSFGNDFAQIIGSIHQSIPKQRGDSVPDYSSLMAKAWSQTNHRLDQRPERPQLVWSGEGGSLLLGHVSIGEGVVKLMRAGKTDEAIEEFLRRERAYVPARFLKPQIVEVLGDIIKQGIREELDDLHADDPGRAFYLFLMQNDQRRKLVRHLENIDLHRLEFQLPFFDSAFLAAVIATPIDLCLRHRFYVKWLSHFPAAVTTAAWQAYPGHEPCPISVPPELSYQWDDKYQAEERATQKRVLLTRASRLLSAPDFPREILNRRNLRLAVWMHSLGLRDLEYAIKAAQTYYDYWRKCDGACAISA